MIGKLPRHQVGDLPEENEMIDNGPYRGEPTPQVAPVERTPLRQHVERIRAEYLAVVEAVESVIVGKREVIERVLTAVAARRSRAARRRPRPSARRAVQGDPRPRLQTRFGPQSSSRPISCRWTSPARTCSTSRIASSQFRPGPILHPHPARRRDQPRHAEDPVRAARGDGGAQPSRSMASPITSPSRSRCSRR